MSDRRRRCSNCQTSLPPPEPRGRPRKYCSDACRWAMRRHWRNSPVPRWVRRQRDTHARRRQLRDQVDRLAHAAGELSIDLRAEDLAPQHDQAGWKRPGPIAGYTAAALPLLARARVVLAAAVTTDRAAGATWEEIAAVLDISADTAARHYRPR